MHTQRATAMRTLGLELNLSAKKTRKREFLVEMRRVMRLWTPVLVIKPHATVAKTVRFPFAIETMPRTHYLQRWFGPSYPAMEEAPRDFPLYREFASLGDGVSGPPHTDTSLDFSRLFESFAMAARLRAVDDILQAKYPLLHTGTDIAIPVAAALIAAPRWTKNAGGARYPERNQIKKSNRWHLGMKAHIGVDFDAGLVQPVGGTLGSDKHVVEANHLARVGKGARGENGRQGVHKRINPQPDVTWLFAMRPGARKAFDRGNPMKSIVDEVERMGASIWATVEHSFWIIKRQFALTGAHYRGPLKNTEQLTMLRALPSLWKPRGRLLGAQGKGACSTAEGPATGPKRAARCDITLHGSTPNRPTACATAAISTCWHARWRSVQSFPDAR